MSLTLQDIDILETKAPEAVFNGVEDMLPIESAKHDLDADRNESYLAAETVLVHVTFCIQVGVAE